MADQSARQRRRDRRWGAAGMLGAALGTYLLIDGEWRSSSEGAGVMAAAIWVLFAYNLQQFLGSRLPLNDLDRALLLPAPAAVFLGFGLAISERTPPAATILAVVVIVLGALATLMLLVVIAYRSIISPGHRREEDVDGSP